MTDLTEDLRKRIDSEERDKIFMEFQERLEKEGVIPGSPNLLLRRYRRILEYTSEIMIGLLVGEISIIIVYLTVNSILHLGL